jgi:hypothetical protein
MEESSLSFPLIPFIMILTLRTKVQRYSLQLQDLHGVEEIRGKEYQTGKE